MPGQLYIGIMSGTSLDGVDAVLAQFDPQRAPRSLAHVHLPLPTPLHSALFDLQSSGADELRRAALAANALMLLYAQAVAELERHAAAPIRAIGAHGQTVRHRPGAFDGTGYTLQLVNGALLAERTGVDVVCDFRSRDVAAGGQGAPLVPAFHRAAFGDRVAVLNVGGIANLTVIGAEGEVCGFDCGPGNLLMDLWCQRQGRGPFDRGGAWAASGKVLPELLSSMRSEPFFAAPPPKSTGRDLFNAAWLDRHLAGTAGPCAPADVMATLAELTARSIADSLVRFASAAAELVVCGGGAQNLHLLERLRSLLPALAVISSALRGVAPEQVEALAFAWLARAFIEREPGNVAAVTGAAGPRILGALYPA